MLNKPIYFQLTVLISGIIDLCKTFFIIAENYIAWYEISKLFITVEKIEFLENEHDNC